MNRPLPKSRRPRVFVSRTTAGLKDIAEKVAVVLRQRGIEPIIQTGFYPSTHDVKGMLAGHLQQCDAVICLIGRVYGSGPHDPITKTEQPVHGLRDPRTKGRLFSYTQLELIIARDLGRPVYTFFIEGDEMPTACAPELPELAQRQLNFITEFAKDGRNTYGTFSHWDQPTSPTRGLKQAIEAVRFEITVLAGKPTNLPYTSLGTLFKGRDQFVAELRQHLTAEGPVVIKGKRTIHGMGGVGKTRAAIEYAWKHADDYHALLFISADTPEALQRNLAALCGPLVLNLPEQNEKEQNFQIEAALRWLKLHPGWLLIIDNVDTDEAAEEAKALLAKLATGHVIITSRISDWTGHVTSLDLDVLSEAASIAFLDERTEERRPKNDDDQVKVAALVQLLDCLALALEQAGAHISSSSISYADYLALWESHRTAALAWHDEEKMKYPKSLAITFETSVGQLSAGARKLFHTLSWFAPDPIPRSLFDSLPHPASEKRHLGEIERLHLARYLNDGRSFTIHRLNQEISRTQQPDEDNRSVTSSVDWLDAALPDNADDVETWDIIKPLVSHVISASLFAIELAVFHPSCKILKCAAQMLFLMGNYHDSEHFMRQSLVAAESAYGKNPQNLSTYLYELSEILRATDRLQDAELFVSQALAADQIHHGLEHPHVARDLSSLGLILLDSHRSEEAEIAMRRALEISEKCWGHNHPDVARDLVNLALLLQEKYYFSEAEALVKRAIEIDECHYGLEHIELATNLGVLTSILRSSGRVSETEPLMRRAVSIAENTFGRNHPKYSLHLSNLARMLLSTNRLSEAEPLLYEVLGIDKACYGETNSKIAADLNNLAILHQNKGNFEESEVLYRQSLAIDEKIFGPNHVEVANDLNNLGEFLIDTNRLTDAEPLLRRALSIHEDRLGKDHTDVATSLSHLASLLSETNRLEEAEQLMRRSLSINEKCLGFEHPDVAVDLTNLAKIIRQSGRIQEAELLLRRAIHVDESCLGVHHSEVAADLRLLADLLQETSRQDEAEALITRALAIESQSAVAH